MKKFTLLIFVSLLSFFSYGQLPLETFEADWVSPAPGQPAAPVGWTVVNEQGPAVTWVRSPLTGPSALPYQGSHAAYLDRENVLPNQPIPRDWLITPAFTIPANGQLRFFSRLTQALDQGGIYKVKISTDPDPTNLAAYQDLQVWTETQLNTVQTQYTEKILTLPAIAGNVFIAFVMEGVQKDRWLIDNVKAVSQCTAPVTLTVSDITLNSAKFDWVNTSGAPEWQIEIVENDATPVEGGVTFTGPPTYTANGTLLPDTIYKVYVRAKCADGGESAWIGPVYFTTGKVGEHCNYPIIINGAPYSTTDNTLDYADNYEATGNSGCNATGNYLSGNDVVYSFTPTANGNYNISLSGTGTGAGVFVYNSCANIGVSCIAGGTGNANLASVALTGGTTYYIVVSTSTAALSTPYKLNIQQVFCASPTGLTATNPTSSSVDINWTAGSYTAWQFAIQPAGAGLPTGAGQNVTTSSINATQATNGPLAPSSSYDVYVRAACGDGNFSIWTGPVSFITTQIPDNINYTQNWETAPHNWTLSNGTQVNKWVVGSAVQNGGTQSLYISNDSGVNNLYTITSASTVHAYRDLIIPATATSLNLAFDWKSIGEVNDNIRVYLVPTNVIPTPGTALSATAPNIKINATNLYNGTSWATFNGVINVTGMGNTTRRLVFEWVNNAATGSQSPAAIDNINLSVITCPAPTNPVVVANSLTSSQVDISWTVPTSVPPGYDYYINTTGTPPTATSVSGTSTTTTKTAIPVTPSATHYFWVRANCGPGDTSTWAGPLTFIAPQVPAGLNYAQNFDGAAPHEWSLNNGAQANKWVVGAATSNSAANSLYISSDNGATNGYNNTSASTVQAYRDITIPPTADQIMLTYDWKSVGETNDYFRVWIVPTTFNPTAGTLVTAAADRIQLVPNTFGGSSTAWTTQTAIIQASGYINTTRRIIFEWRNDGANGATPPAAIDNINISLISCPQPSALALGSLVSGSANFTWTAPVSGAPGYEYFLTTDTTIVPNAATVESGDNTSTSLNLPGLPPSTNYNIWVRSDCGSSKSLWIGPVNFTTPQDPAPMNYTQNFDGTTHGFDFRNGNLANKWAVGSATSNSGANSLYISNDNGVNNGYTITSAGVVHAYRDIQLPGAVDQILLSFDWKSVGDAGDYFRVWMVPVDYIIPANAQITAGTGREQVTGNFTGNNSWVTFNYIFSALAYQGQTRRLVFEWRNDAGGGVQPPAAIDNINFSVVTCPAPTNLNMTLNNLAGTTFTWTPPSSVTPTFDFYYTTSPTPPNSATSPSGNVSTPIVTLTGLPDSTNYYFWVRDNCGPGDTSLWIGPFEFSTPQVASPLNYNQNFDGNTYGWTLANSNQVNRWIVGTDVSNSPGKSLYISNNGSTNTYTISGATSTVHAYKDFIIPGDATELDFSFDWRNQGEGTWDYIKVWRVPTTFVPTNGTLITAAADRVQIGGLLSANANWTSASHILDATGFAGQNIRIIFEWRNDSGGGSNPAGAIDNVDLSVITCPKPTGLGATAVTQTGATFNWTEAGTASAWEVYVVPAGQPAPTAATEAIGAGTNPFAYTTPALQPSTNYVYYVRAVCATDDKSKWAGPFAFRTAIGNDECSGATVLIPNPYTDPCQNFATASYSGATPSSQIFDCQITNGADIWFEFVATSDRHNIELSDFAVWEWNQAQPIVIALYEGDQCGVMSQIGCSNTNVFVGKSLNVGSTYRFRLFINSLTPNLNTSFKVCVNTPAPPDDTNTDACTVTTINHSFEQPIRPDLTVPPSPYPFPISQFAVPGWRTTATDNRMEFWPTPNYEGVPAYEGNQFVELNAEQVAGFYQDYPTPQPTTFTYKFAHRGRRGPDTCKLFAGSPNDQNVYDEVTTATTSNTEWVVYTGTYTSPPGQLVTRFIFQSVSATGGDPTIGNFLDAIEFTADNGIVSYGPENLTCIDNVLSVVASGSGEWSAAPTNPSETIIADPGSNTTTITGFRGNGEYRFDWTTQYCKSTVVVNYNNGNVSEPVTTTPIEYCMGETASPLTATALANHTINWYTTATGGTASTTAPTPDTATSNTTVYYVAQQSADNCESDRVAITVNVYATVAAPAAQTFYEYCQDVPATQLTATAVTGHTLNWYTVPTGGTATPTAPTPSTAAAVVGETKYYVSQSNANGCESNRTEITVLVNASVIPVTEFSFANTTICVEDTTNPVAIKADGFSTDGIFSTGVGLIIHPTTGQINLGGSTPGTYTVTYTVMPDEDTCNIGGSTSRQITIAPLAAAVTAFSYSTPVCSDTASQLPVFTAGYAAGGIFTADAGLVIDAATGEINVAATPAGTYEITYSVDENTIACTAAGESTASITIVQVVTPVLGFDYDDNFCFNGADTTPTLAAGFNAGGIFEGTPGLVIDPVTGVVLVSASTSGTHTVTYTFAGDPANCVQGGTSTSTFTIGTELGFGFEGFCDGIVFIVEASPETGEFDDNDANVSFMWTNTNGTVIGTDSHILNVTEYADSTPENDTFPMDVNLTVTVNGCETTRTFTVDGIGCSIQKGISPNNDGLNDYFDLEFMGVKKLSIFNRYGQEVYTKSNYTNEWNGQSDNGNELPTGTYYYVIERIAGGTNTGWIYINRQE